MKELFGIHIDFAHRTFRWDSEASLKAHVHCVIVGFSNVNVPKVIYDNDKQNKVENISAYLIDAPDIYIESRTNALCNVPKMVYGNKPVDGGFLFLTPEEKKAALTKEPFIEKYIKRIYGSEEYIKNKERYCLWLVNANPTDLRNSSFIHERIEQVRKFRLSSPKKATQLSAETSTLFQENRQPTSNYIIVPSVSSETRRYVPMGFLDAENIVNNLVLIVPNATLYHLESKIGRASCRERV